MDDPRMQMPMQHHKQPQQHMSFFWGTNFALLFSGWVPSTPLLYILTLLAAFALAIFHEFVNHIRTNVVNPQALAAGKGYSSDLAQQRRRIGLHMALELLVYAAYVTSSYILMMMIMSFNAGIFLAVIFGLCVGFFIFRLLRNTRLLSQDSPVVSSTV